MTNWMFKFFKISLSGSKILKINIIQVIFVDLAKLSKNIKKIRNKPYINPIEI